MTTGSVDPSYALQLVSVNNIQHYNYTPQKSKMEPEKNYFKMNLPLLAHRIHGTGIFTYIYHKVEPNVGDYTSPMDPMGRG